MRYSAFISYNHRDRDWAIWLHRSLERTGGGRGIAHRQFGAREHNAQARIVWSLGECLGDQRLRARRILGREARFSLLE